MASWITIPRTEGVSSRQAHADLPSESFERELGREGFYGPSTQMYHKHPPTAWTRIDGPLRPRAFDTGRLEMDGSSPWDALPLISNDNLQLRIWIGKQSMDHLIRNGDGDELIFVHLGEGDLFTDYGHLTFRAGDYILLPRGTLWRVEFKDTVNLLMIEATNDSYRLPDKGIAGQHAVFDPAVLNVPIIDNAFHTQQSEKEWRVVIKRRGKFSSVVYPFNPLDALGWHGTLMPVSLNWRDIRPVMSHRYHMPPSVHTTFISDRFVICTFTPRPIESDPGALKLPFFHNNDDYDEVIFFHRGQFFSRDNFYPGMLTLHPAGITHGPHPKALKAATGYERKETDEVAVMIDARDALEISPQAKEVEWKQYVDSWNAYIK